MKTKIFSTVIFSLLIISSAYSFQKDEINTLHKKALNVYKTSLDSFYIYSDIAYKKARKLNYTKGMALNQTIRGWVHRNNGKYDLAMENYTKALFLYERSNSSDYYNFASIFNNIAIIYADFKLYEEASHYYDSALIMFNKYMDFDYDDSLAHKLKELSYFKAETMINTGDETKVQLGLDILKSIYDKKDALNGADILNKLGLAYNRLGEYEVAREQFDLIFSHPQLSLEYKGRVYHNIGLTYLDQGILSKSEEYYLKAFEIKKQLKNKRSLFITMLDLGDVYVRQRKYQEAVNIMEEALGTYDQITRKPEYYNIYDLLATAYTRIDLAKYDHYNALYKAANEAYTSKQQQLKSDVLQKKIQVTVDHFKRDLLREEERQQFLERYWISTLFVSVIIVFLAIYFVRSYRKRNKDYKARTAALIKIKEINEEVVSKGFWYLPEDPKQDI